MTGHRILYAAALLCCVLFDVAYGAWLSGIVLLTVLGLPWFSLLLSLPGILSFRLGIRGDAVLPQGGEGDLWLAGSSHFPILPFKGKLVLTHCVTGETRPYRPHQGLPTIHCGGLKVRLEKGRVCDYLGLFAFPVGKKEQRTVLIRPQPLPVQDAPDLKRYIAKSWRPKFGGGFSENHEIRLYRPGDSLNQVHWKLSAKTGKLTVREPMIPQRGLVLLTMTLRGSYSELDRKFGRLLWLGSFLTEQNVAFELRILTGEGVQAIPVSDERELHKAIDQLLCAPAAREGDLRDREFAASWQYHIGGEPDEGK